MLVNFSQHAQSYLLEVSLHGYSSIVRFINLRHSKARRTTQLTHLYHSSNLFEARTPLGLSISWCPTLVWYCTLENSMCPNFFHSFLCFDDAIWIGVRHLYDTYTAHVRQLRWVSNFFFSLLQPNLDIFLTYLRLVLGLKMCQSNAEKWRVKDIKFDCSIFSFFDNRWINTSQIHIWSKNFLMK